MCVGYSGSLSVFEEDLGWAGLGQAGPGWATLFC